jgi:hypothetical protein
MDSMRFPACESMRDIDEHHQQAAEAAESCTAEPAQRCLCEFVHAVSLKSFLAFLSLSSVPCASLNLDAAALAPVWFRRLILVPSDARGL